MIRRLAALALVVSVAFPAVGEARRLAVRNSNFFARAAQAVRGAISEARQSVHARWFVSKLTATRPSYKKVYREVDQRAFEAAGAGHRPFAMLGGAGSYYLRQDLRTAGATARMAVIDRAVENGVGVPAGVQAYAGRVRSQLPQKLVQAAGAATAAGASPPGAR